MTESWSKMRTVRPRRRRGRWLVAAAVALTAAAAAAVVLVVRDPGSNAALPASPSGGTTQSTTPPSTGTTTHTARAKVVHVTALQNDGATYGVGMPIVLYFSRMPRDAKAFEDAVNVTVDGRPAGGAWYWEQPDRDEVRRHIVEAHYRPDAYWPADSRIHVDIPIGGLSAGPGLVYSDKLTSLDYRIGDAHISTVDAGTLRMRVTSNGRRVGDLRVSLGEANNPTYNGTKVVMQRGENVPGTDRLRPAGTVLMSGRGYTDQPVQWSVRITRSGEYVHAAPWNSAIGQRSTSHGCTNLRTADAEWFYKFSRIGDVVEYTNTDGPTMPAADGFGDWNIPWAQWQQGGLLAR